MTLYLFNVTQQCAVAGLPRETNDGYFDAENANKSCVRVHGGQSSEFPIYPTTRERGITPGPLLLLARTGSIPPFAKSTYYRSQISTRERQFLAFKVLENSIFCIKRLPFISLLSDSAIGCKHRRSIPGQFNNPLILTVVDLQRIICHFDFPAFQGAISNHLSNQLH